MYAANRGPNMKCGSTDFKWGARHDCPLLATAMCRMCSIQSCYFCVLDVEMLWFWMCLRQVSILCHFFLFLRCVLVVFNSPVLTLAHRLLGHSPSLRLWFILENASLLACFIYLCHHPPSHFTNLLTGALFIVALVTVHVFWLLHHRFESPSHPKMLP